jgi:mono/diheme cytochrome c family protein
MNVVTKALGIAVLLTGMVLAVLLVTSANGAPVSSASVHAAMPAPAAATAESVYLDKCAVCHGKDGSGNTAKGRKVKAKDLRSAEVQKMTDKELLEAVGKGKGKDMDGFEKELGADMVKQLVAYCRGFAKH